MKQLKNITYENFTKTILALSFALQLLILLPKLLTKNHDAESSKPSKCQKPNPDEDYTAQNDFARIGDKKTLCNTDATKTKLYNPDLVANGPNYIGRS